MRGVDFGEGLSMEAKLKGIVRMTLERTLKSFVEIAYSP